MSIRPDPGRAAAAAIAFLLSITPSAVPALAQPWMREAVKSQDELPWLGCWDVLPDPEGDAQEPTGERLNICVASGEVPTSLEMTVLVDDEIVSTETVVTDGSRQPVSDGGCDGWIRSVLSEDRRRLYLQSEATCPDSGPRNLTGASIMVSGDRWIDIHALWADGEREVLIQRYRPDDANIPRLPGELPTAMHTIRRDAAARLTVENVIEALQVVDPAVVEAMLIESDARFGIDSDLLLRLDAAGVPDDVIDLMVALSFPEYFVVEDGSITRQPAVYYGGYWSPWYPYYGYGHYYYHRYGHGSGHHGADRGGRVVSGRGYVSVQQTGEPSGGFPGFQQGLSNAGGGSAWGGVSSGNSGGRAGSASSSGYKSGNASSNRPAVPQ